MNKDATHVILQLGTTIGWDDPSRKPGNGATKSRKTAKGESTMEKNWENSIMKINGTLATDENGKIVFSSVQFGKRIKYTAKLNICEKTPLATLRRRNTYVFIDNLRPEDVNAFREMEEAGDINAETYWTIEGHLVKNTGNASMNDLYNLKVMSVDLALENKPSVINFDDALTKDEWQKIYTERKAERLAAKAAAAPTAPVAPAVPV